MKISKILSRVLSWWSVGVMLMWSVQMSAQCSLVCNDDIQISLFGNNNLTISPEMLLINPSVNCPNGDFTIEVFDELGNNLGDQVNPDYLNQQLTYNIFDSITENYCEGSLTLVDQIPPVVSCQNIFLPCYGDFSPELIGFPSVSDNIDELSEGDLNYSDVFTDLDCFTMLQGQMVTAQIERHWTVQDESGNESECVQNIYLLRSTLSDIVFPADLNDLELASLSCDGDDPTDLEFTGVPTLGDMIPAISGSCEFTVTYSDQLTNFCAGKTRILRTWSVLDLCSDEVAMDIQVIEVKDLTPPVLECPDLFTFTTLENSCTSTVSLEPPTVSDNCSQVDMQVSWVFGSGYGPFYDIPVGEYEITYTAEDECGNVSVCTSNVLVEDDQSPTAVCEQVIEVSLSNDGNGIAHAYIFDDGSHDNCGIDRYEISRDDITFNNQVSFSCEDVEDSPIAITLRVYDIYGLYSDCHTNVYVEESILPEISCPADVEIVCMDDYMDLTLTGQPEVADACGVLEILYSDETNLNECGYGVITRTWLAEDINGNMSSCEQIITISDNTQASVSFPEDVTFFSCGPETGIEITGEPAITGADCETLDVTYVDQEFLSSFPACYKILRHWTVVDWCRYDANSGNTDGYWEHTQTIRIRDSIPPQINCISEMTAGIVGQHCETFVSLPLPEVFDCSPDITITNDSPFADAPGADAGGVYPEGIYIITYTATDGCDNSATCQLELIVEDQQPPTPVCMNGVTIPLNADGQIYITPSMVSLTSTDNCSASADLLLDVYPNSFSCDDIGMKEVIVTAYDEVGNSSFCSVFVQIQDNENHCNVTETVEATIAGSLMTKDGLPLSNTPVVLDGKEVSEVATEVSGTYAHPSADVGELYEITPISPEDYSNGVSTFDLIKMKKHILGIQTFDSPYDHIAADVNNSGSVSTFDMVQLRKLILQIDTAFSNNTSWRFVDASYEMEASAFDGYFPESIVIEELNADSMNNHFVAVKIGDLNGSADSNNFTAESEDRNSLNWDLKVEELTMEPGYEYRIPVKAAQANTVEGFQFTVEYDNTTLEFSRIEKMDLPLMRKNNFGLNLLEEGKITVSWDYYPSYDFVQDDELFTLVFNAKRKTRLSDAFNINSSAIQAEAYPGAEKTNHIQTIGLTFEQVIEKGSLELYPNMPNPFRTETNIRFYLREAAEVSIEVYDITGKKRTERREKCTQGYHEISIDDTELKDYSGILFYHITTPKTRRVSGKMIRIVE